MVSRNLVANFLGQSWAAVMGLAFVPVYIRYLGIEAYGLIGIFAMLQTWLALLDMGLTPTLGREMARYAGGEHSPDSIRDLLRTSEWISMSLALFMTASVWAGSHWLATDWIRNKQLPTAVVAEAFTIMGLVAALRFVEGVYRSAVVGLQRQVLLNAVSSILVTVRWVGAIGILAWVSPTLTAFFAWQACISVVTTVALSKVTYSGVEKGTRAGRFSLAALQGVWRFAAGMFGISLLALMLTQVDKLLLSRILSLADFGYYALASTVAGGLYFLMKPVTQAFYPSLCEQHARGNAEGFVRTYHKGAQTMAVLLGSTAIVIAMFSEMLLRLWTQNADLATHTSRLLTLLAVGNMLHGLVGIPYYAQLALGWTSLSIAINTAAIFVIVPAILWSVPRYGAEGAAWVWLSLATGYVFIGAHFFFRKITYLGKLQWYWKDIALPLLGAFVPVMLLRWLAPFTDRAFDQFAILAAASICAFAGAVLCADQLRGLLLKQATGWAQRVFA